MALFYGQTFVVLWSKLTISISSGLCLKARHVGNKVLLISLFRRRHGVNKMGLFFLKARHVVNKVLLISLFQRRHGVDKMGLSDFG